MKLERQYYRYNYYMKRLYYYCNESIYRNRIFWFWSIIFLIFLSFIAYIFLYLWDDTSLYLWNDDWKNFFTVGWAILSLLIGSIVFMQLQGRRKIHTIKDLMDTLISIIQETREGNIYIITTNMNIGQTQVPSRFDNYIDSIKKIPNEIGLHFCVWGLENELLRFDLNIENFNSTQNIIQGTYKDDICHMKYVFELIKNNSSKTSGEETKKIGWELRKYNTFVSELSKKSNVHIYRIDKPNKKEDLFFLVCNKEKLYVSSVRSDIISAELIEEKGFIDAILENVKEKFFNTNNEINKKEKIKG